jgi:hypothetical protein
MLYELVAGARPFTGSSAFAIAQAHLTTLPPKLPPTAPRALQPILDRALAKQIGDRYASAAEMRAALAAMRSPPAPRGRKRWIAIAAALGLVAGGALAIVLLASSAEPAPTPVDAAVTRVTDAPRATQADSARGGVLPAPADAIARLDAELATVVRDRALLPGDLPADLASDYARARDGTDVAAIVTAGAALVEAARALAIDKSFTEHKRRQLVKTWIEWKHARDSDAVSVALARDLESAQDQINRGDYEAANTALNAIDKAMRTAPPPPHRRHDDDLFDPDGIR